MSGKHVIRRLSEAGVTYRGDPPTRAHYTCRGQEPRTWLARRDAYGLATRLAWQIGAPGGRVQLSGGEVLLDAPAYELSQTDCLVLYTMPRNPWDLCVTSLDGFARLRRNLISARAHLWHWQCQRCEPIGRHVIVLADRLRGLVTERRAGRLTVHVEDQSSGPRYLSPSEVQIGETLCPTGDD